MHRRSHTALTILIVWMIVLTVAMTSQAQVSLTVTVNPTQGFSGDRVNISVKGATPSRSGEIRIGNPPSRNVVTISALGTGGISNLPIYGSPGLITITFVDGAGVANPLKAQTPYTILPLQTPRVPRRLSRIPLQLGNFTAPQDAVMSLDGGMVYFNAKLMGVAASGVSPLGVNSDPLPEGIFAVPSIGGKAALLTPDGSLEKPIGLLLSCDGRTLYIANQPTQANDADASLLYTLDVESNVLSTLPSTGIGEAAGLAFNTDCSTLYVTGYTPEGEPALFTLEPEGGEAMIVFSGAPLVSPSGVYVDEEDTAWVMDRNADNPTGGLLWAVRAGASIDVVIGGLDLSAPAGVSLVAGGDIAVIPSLNINGLGQLLLVDTVSGDISTLSTPEIVEPAGIRSARQAPVMVVVDSQGDAIFLVE